MAISDWPEDERPRERLLAHGAASLSDAELLAIFLRVGVKGKSAVDLGRELISRFSGLNRMFAASQAEFSALPGMGPAKYAQLQAVLEMARRALGEEMRQGIAFASPGAVRTWIQAYNALLETYNTYGAAEIAAEVKAVRDTGCTGSFMTWNGGSDINKYQSIISALR